MTRDPRFQLDDSAIEVAVRDAVGAWEMPPTRLDRGWRARVRTPRDRRIEGLRGWLGRAGRAASAGVALTVGAALLAVALTGPRTPIGSSGPSGTPGGSGDGRATPGTAATPLPRLLVEGGARIPQRVLVRIESDFAVADLTTGTIASTLAVGAASWASAVRVEPDGSYTCLCVEIASSSAADEAKVGLVRFRADGSVAGRVDVASHTGTADPRPGSLAESPRDIDVAVSFDPDGRRGYVGWTAREHPAWRSGIDIVDLGSGKVVGSVPLPNATDGEGDTRTVAFAPAIVGRDATGGLLVSRGWYSWRPADATDPTYTSGSDAFTVPASGDGFGSATVLAAGGDCGDAVEHAGVRAGGGLWLDCARPTSGEHRFRLVAPDGRVERDLSIAMGGPSSGTSAPSADGTALYYWDPLSLVLTRVDVSSGATTRAQAPRPTALADDPLRALGRWLAPTAAAKILLDAGLVLSPDGSTAYALGIGGAGLSEPYAASSGVFAFDTTTMTPTARWVPPADLVSLAVSTDGRYVLAAGAPGVDADGRETGQPASIVAFDAADGRLALVAGQLGHGMLLLASSAVGGR